MFGQPSFLLSAFNGKKVTNVPLALIFLTLYLSVCGICLMTGFDLWWVKQNAVLLYLQCRPRCTVRTFNSLHAASLGIQYGRECVDDYQYLEPFHLRRYLLFTTQGIEVWIIILHSNVLRLLSTTEFGQSSGCQRPALSVTLATGSSWPHRTRGWILTGPNISSWSRALRRL